ncbi:MAG: serine hydrolase, partial [Sphaerospermopsis kisseleviana]
MVFFNHNEQLENLGNEILESTFSNFPNLNRDQIALTWV